MYVGSWARLFVLECGDGRDPIAEESGAARACREPCLRSGLSGRLVTVGTRATPHHSDRSSGRLLPARGRQGLQNLRNRAANNAA